MNKIIDHGVDNHIDIQDSGLLESSISVRGNNNVIKIKKTAPGSSINIIINGDNSVIDIGIGSKMKGLSIYCGNHIPAHNTSITIGDNFSIEPNGIFYLYNSGNLLEIGDSCMFSNNVKIRCGESPHLIFDINTGVYLDVSKGVKIGNHVWLGENCYLTKSSSINSDCIVGACSVVTRMFDEKNCVIAGNPAKIVKRDVCWVRNKTLLPVDSMFYESYHDYNSKFTNS